MALLLFHHFWKYSVNLSFGIFYSDFINTITNEKWKNQKWKKQKSFPVEISTTKSIA